MDQRSFQERQGAYRRMAGLDKNLKVSRREGVQFDRRPKANPEA